MSGRAAQPLTSQYSNTITRWRSLECIYYGVNGKDSLEYGVGNDNANSPLDFDMIENFKHQDFCALQILNQSLPFS